eukprot:1741724-Prymnesium_polylepis.1
MPGGEDASPGYAGELVARSCVVCRHVICSLRCLNTDANDRSRKTHGPARGPGQSRMLQPTSGHGGVELERTTMCYIYRYDTGMGIIFDYKSTGMV